MKPLLDEVNLQKLVQATFGLRVEIKSVVAKVPAGAGTLATVFLSDKGLLFTLIVARGGQNLGDVKKILTRMNLKPEQFLPPHADAQYFDRIAEKKFQEVFPSRKATNDADLAFYRTLVPYNPALVQIAEVTNGVIKQYDSDAATHWRPGAKFAYRRIKTS